MYIHRFDEGERERGIQSSSADWPTVARSAGTTEKGERERSRLDVNEQPSGETQLQCGPDVRKVKSSTLTLVSLVSIYIPASNTHQSAAVPDSYRSTDI